MIFKRMISLFSVIVFVLTFQAGFVFAGNDTVVPEVSAQAAVVICADSHDILYGKNIDVRLPIASTTKIMTSLLALEQVDALDRMVSVTRDMVTVEGSSMGLKVGDKLSLYSLAQGMLLVSGNDAANSVALSLANSYPDFAFMMNARAEQFGMMNTHFVTPSGLDDENHFSTAFDMAILGSYALDNDSFRGITSSKSMKVRFELPKKTVSYHNKNKLVSLYDGCIGVKTGFTKRAGRCLVSAAERDGVRLVAVTINAPNDWSDHEKMLDYGFNSAVKISVDDTNLTFIESVVGGTKDEVTVSPMFERSLTLSRNTSTNLEKRVLLPPFVYAPVRQGQKLGCVEYLSDGAVVSTVDLTAQTPVDYKSSGGFIDFIKGLFEFGK